MRRPTTGRPAPEGGRRERRKAWTRQELIIAGRNLFSRHGLYESRIEDLTRQAGIAKGTLYQYFRSKEELIQAVVTVGFDELSRHVNHRTQRARTLRGIVRGIVQAHLEFYADNPDLMRVFHQVRGLLKFNQRRWSPLRATLRLHIERLTTRLAQASSSLERNPDRRRELAIVLFGSVSGTVSVRAAASPRARVWPGAGSLPGAFAALALAFAAAGGRRPAGSKQGRAPTPIVRRSWLPSPRGE